MDQRLADHTIALAASLRSEIAALTADEEAIRDTLEGEVNLDEVLDFLIAGIDQDEAMLVALEAQVLVREKRMKRLKERVAAQKAMICKALTVSGWNSRERPAATLSMDRKAPALGQLDLSKIPARFWVQPDPTLDRAALLKALKDKEDIPGAALAAEGHVLKIRRG